VHWSRLMGVFTMTCGIFDTRGRCAPKPVELGFLARKPFGKIDWRYRVEPFNPGQPHQDAACGQPSCFCRSVLMDIQITLQGGPLRPGQPHQGAARRQLLGVF